MTTKRMSLKFHTSVKKHDGLCDQSRLLQDLVFAYFEAQILHSPERTKEFVQARMNTYKMDPEKARTELHDQLSKLISKTHELDSNKSVPVLERGGGKGLVVACAHCPHLRRLHMWLTTKGANTSQC